MDNLKTITIITGSFPPKVCGVGDYTAKLSQELAHKTGHNIQVFYKDNWLLSNFRSYLRELKHQRSCIYHLQYPTEGYSYSLLPLILFLFLPIKKRVVTIHELSSRNLAAYIYTTLLIILSCRTIVSNELEKKHACRFLFSKKKVNVIPIASNIAESPNSQKQISARTVDVAYFGHIRPLKGIEDFIRTKLLVSKKVVSKIIGQSLPNYQPFYREVLVLASNNGIEVIANKEESEIQELLADTKILYLPYPDGISNRRGTLLAGIQNGCIIVSRKSENEDFNNFFEDSCYLINSSEEAATLIEEILFSGKWYKTTEKLKSIFSWQNVVEMHLAVYQNI